MGDSHQGKDFHDGQRLALPEKYLRHAAASTPGAIPGGAPRMPVTVRLSLDPPRLSDHDGLAAAVDDILARKPHSASRKPVGDIGKGAMASSGSGADLAALLRGQGG